jgi:hypothetical protein
MIQLLELLLPLLLLVLLPLLLLLALPYSEHVQLVHQDL